MSKKPLDLVKVIQENPGCIAMIDNDCWFLYRKELEERTEDQDWDDFLIAKAGNVKRMGDGGYGSGECYGGDILQALAVIVGIKIRSV